MAQNDFTNSSIDHRTDLQSRLLRKVHINSWQKNNILYVLNNDILILMIDS